MTRLLSLLADSLAGEVAKRGLYLGLRWIARVAKKPDGATYGAGRVCSAEQCQMDKQKIHMLWVFPEALVR